MGRYSFIHENPHGPKIRALVTAIGFLFSIGIIALFVILNWTSLVDRFPLLHVIVGEVESNILQATPTGMFYEHFLGGIFFVPSPDELMFYYGLTKANSFFYPFIFAICGYMLAQLINYYLGLKASPFILYFISIEKVYRLRRLVNKYGVYLIFIFNVLPLPGPLITFALGIAKYNFQRLFFTTLVGKICKFVIIFGIYLWVSKYYL